MKKTILTYLEAAQTAAKSHGACSENLAEAAECLKEVFEAGGRLYVCGNGGSTCDAMHLVEELVARYKRERPGIPAQHLCDAATLTCWSNDYDFKSAFARQVRTLARSGDALLVFSTSGNSANILEALQAAAEIGCRRIGFLGRGGGKAASLCDISVIVASEVTSHIQEAHAVFIHALCEALETALFPEAR